MFRFPQSEDQDGQQDSFEIQEHSRKIPQPTPVESGDHNYQLTFKKDQQGQYFLKNPKSSTNRVLFSPSDRLLLQTIAEPISSFYLKSVEELSSLPFADLYCLQLSEGRKLKLKLIGEIIEVKRLRMKITSANVNIRCLKQKQNKTQEDKHRLFLLELLWKQLNKKVFIEGLKLNLTDGLYQRRTFKDVEEEEGSYMQEDKQRHRISEQFIEEVEEENEGIHKEWSKHSDVEDDESKQEIIMNQIIILNQIMASIINRTLFVAFSCLQKSVRTRKKQPLEKEKDSSIQNNNKANNNQKDRKKNTEYQQERQNTEQQDKEMILMPSDRKPIHYLSPSQQNSGYEQQQQISPQRLQQLCQYIEELHEQCSNSTSLLQKYFIKWKIYLLERIAESGFLQIKKAEYDNENEEQIELRRSTISNKDIQQDHDQSQMLSNSNNFLSPSDSRLTSELSRGQTSLKVQKKQLKEFIKINQSRLFLNKLRDAFELSRIALICKQVRNQNIVKRAFKGLKINHKQQIQSQELEDYFNEVSNNQSEDDGTSKLFHKTNLLYRYFKNMQKHLRNSKVCQLIAKVIKSFAYRKLFQFSVRQRRFLQQQVRQMQKINNRLAFKYFRIWKQAYNSSQPYLPRLKQYFKVKDKDKLQYYFSILSYHYKVSLLQKRKAQKYYRSKLERKMFYKLKEIVQEGRQTQEIVSSLNHYLKMRRQSWFIFQFKKFYCDTIEHQRFAIKEEKLRRNLLKLQALRGIRQWRKLHLRKTTYQVIQTKLTRLKAKQRKREIFTLWHDRTFDHQHQYSSNRSQQHKDWLVRYYGDLCAVVPQ